MLNGTESTPTWPNEKFCAVGGFLDEEVSLAVPEHGIAAAHPMLMSFQNRAVNGAWILS